MRGRSFSTSHESAAGRGPEFPPHRFKVVKNTPPLACVPKRRPSALFFFTAPAAVFLFGKAKRKMGAGSLCGKAVRLPRHALWRKKAGPVGSAFVFLFYRVSISALTAASQLRWAWMVRSSSLSNSQPRRSAPVLMTSREHPAANFLSLNFFFRELSSMS